MLPAAVWLVTVHLPEAERHEAYILFGVGTDMISSRAST